MGLDKIAAKFYQGHASYPRANAPASNDDYLT